MAESEVRCGRCDCLSMGGDSDGGSYGAGLLRANRKAPAKKCKCMCHDAYRFVNDRVRIPDRRAELA